MLAETFPHRFFQVEKFQGVEIHAVGPGGLHPPDDRQEDLDHEPIFLFRNPKEEALQMIVGFQRKISFGEKGHTAKAVVPDPGFHLSTSLQGKSDLRSLHGFYPVISPPLHPVNHLGTFNPDGLRRGIHHPRLKMAEENLSVGIFQGDLMLLKRGQRLLKSPHPLNEQIAVIPLFPHFGDAGLPGKGRIGDFDITRMVRSDEGLEGPSHLQSADDFSHLKLHGIPPRVLLNRLLSSRSSLPFPPEGDSA